jgi:hypothetical protein
MIRVRVPVVISPSPGPARADHINKPGTDGNRPTRTDGDPQPAPAGGTTITVTSRPGQTVARAAGPGFGPESQC